MRWEGREKSKNVDDRRRGTTAKVAGGIGIGTMLMIGLFMLLGEDPTPIIQNATQNQGRQQTQQSQSGPRADDKLADFVSVVLKDCEDVWNKLFRENFGKNYSEPTLVIFDGKAQSACGFASAATGPFYCPGDQKLYIDLDFYRQLQQRFGAPGDFAMAYVVAHEVAHHVQFLLGITDYVHKQKRVLSEKEYNKLSVRLELQADFLAGVWAHHGQKDKNFLEEGDIEEALNAAHAIGDDTIQKKSRGYVVPDAFTHGSSEQRMRWFMKGFKTGDIDQGDTFGATLL